MGLSPTEFQALSWAHPHKLKRAPVSVGNFIRISENVSIDCSAPVTINDNVWISQNVMILNHEHIIVGKELKTCDNINLSAGLMIEEDAWVGAAAIIMPKVKRIGKGAIIGAGSIVTHDVDDYSIVAGNPAKVIGERK